MKFEKKYTVSFTLDYNPANLSTAQEKGVRIVRSRSGKYFPTFYKKKKVAQNEADLKRLIQQAHPLVKYPTIINDGDTCVNLEIVYFFPHTSTTPQWKRNEITFMTQRPDADNISKTVVDCMTACGIWQDDSMVNFSFKKFRSPKAKIDISYDVWVQSRN